MSSKIRNIDVQNTNKLIQYDLAIQKMKNRVDQIILNTNKELIWFLNHDHIYTQGKSASKNEILKKK